MAQRAHAAPYSRFPSQKLNWESLLVVNTRSLLIALSLAANVAFAAVYLPRWFSRSKTPTPEIAARNAALATRRAEANATVQAARAAAAQVQLWSTLDSDDLKALVTHLRAAGFPASMIRAVINARIQAQFDARLADLAGSPQNTPYWKPLASSSQTLNAKYSAERNQIYRDRAKLLREILGDELLNADAGEVTAVQRRQYGDLPKSKIDLVQRIAADYDEMTAQTRAAMLGIALPEDREKFSLLEREKRVDLTAILTPQELEDYEMRSSMLTARLRSAFTIMDATEDEFRAIFRLQQPFDSVINPVGGTMTPEMNRQRIEAQKQVQEQIKTTLGEQRAADYARASDYEFQRLAQLAQRENVPLSAAAATFDLRANTALKSRQISDDSTLSYEQKLAALKSLAQTTETQIIAQLGTTAGATYTKSADWLRLIANGAFVELSNGGLSTRQVQPPRPIFSDSPSGAGRTPGN